MNINNKILLFPVCILAYACNQNSTADRNTSETLSDSSSVIAIEPPSQRPHTDSVWFKDILTEAQVCPYEQYRPQQWEKARRLTSDTTIGSRHIETFIVADTMEFAWNRRLEPDSNRIPMVYSPLGIIVINDRERNRTDSIHVRRKLLERFLDEDLIPYALYRLVFDRSINDTLTFNAMFPMPDTDWGPEMEIHILDNKLSMKEIYTELGGD